MTDELDPETVAEIEAALAAGMDESRAGALAFDEYAAKHIEAEIYRQDDDLDGNAHHLFAGRVLPSADGPLDEALQFEHIDSGPKWQRLFRNGRNLDRARDSIILAVVLHSTATNAVTGESTPARMTFVKTPYALHSMLRTAADPETVEHTTEMPEAGTSMLAAFLAFAILAEKDDDE